MQEQRKVAILGGGNAAFGVAADLALKGHHVRMLEAPEFLWTIQPVLKEGGIFLENPGITGFANGFANIPVVSTDPAEVIPGADVILYLVPGFAERRFTELIGPFLNSHQLVVFFCGVFGGALEFSHTLRPRLGSNLPMIAETEALLYGSFKSGLAKVRLTARKNGLAIAALPASQNQVVIDRLAPLFPGFTQAENVIDTGLRNANLVIHPPVCILNAGRIDPSAEKFQLYWQGVTPPVGKVVEAVDRERLRVARELGLSLPPMSVRLLEWYSDQGAKGNTLAEIMSTNPPYKNVFAPQQLDHRFITEDIPYGLVPLEDIGRSFNCPTPVTTALITLANELLGEDLRAKGRNMRYLGFDQLTPSEIRASL